MKASHGAMLSAEKTRLYQANLWRQRQTGLRMDMGTNRQILVSDTDYAAGREVFVILCWSAHSNGRLQHFIILIGPILTFRDTQSSVFLFRMRLRSGKETEWLRLGLGSGSGLKRLSLGKFNQLVKYISWAERQSSDVLKSSVQYVSFQYYVNLWRFQN